MNKEEKLLSCTLWWLVDEAIYHKNYQETIIGRKKIKNLEARKKKVLLRESLSCSRKEEW